MENELSSLKKLDEEIKGLELRIEQKMAILDSLQGANVMRILCQFC